MFDVSSQKYTFTNSNKMRKMIDKFESAYQAFPLPTMLEAGQLVLASSPAVNKPPTNIKERASRKRRSRKIMSLSPPRPKTLLLNHLVHIAGALPIIEEEDARSRWENCDRSSRSLPRPSRTTDFDLQTSDDDAKEHSRRQHDLRSQTVGQKCSRPTLPQRQNSLECLVLQNDR